MEIFNANKDQLSDPTRSNQAGIEDSSRNQQ